MRLVPRSAACWSALSRSIHRCSTKTASSWSANSMPGAAWAAAGRARLRRVVARASFRIISNSCRHSVRRLKGVLAVFAKSLSADEPLSGLVVGEQPEPRSRTAGSACRVRAASLNHHDLWSLRGVGLREDALPMILGCDAAGVDEDGNEVVVHSVISDPDWRGDETLDPRRSILSEIYAGTFAERVAVPRRNLVPKPAGAVVRRGGLPADGVADRVPDAVHARGVTPGSTLLVQGAGGGVATALIVLGRAAGLRVWATSRSEEKRARALELGADAVFEPGARLPERVDVVVETVGAATWDHSLKSLKPGGTLVISGATSGGDPARGAEPHLLPAALVVGSTMGTRDELDRLVRLCVERDVRRSWSPRSRWSPPATPSRPWPPATSSASSS